MRVRDAGGSERDRPSRMLHACHAAVVDDAMTFTRRGLTIALGLVATAALVGIATPRVPAVWSSLWGIADVIGGGVDERREALVDHPFPAALAPPGYRREEVREIVDPDGSRSGVTVTFAGPDDQNSIAFYPQGMTAAEILDYWTRGDEALGLRPLPVEELAANAYCHEGPDVFRENHEVSCIAAFDGMAIIADSANANPARGDVRHALTLLRAGIEHWKTIRD